MAFVTEGDGSDAARSLLSTYQTIENTICAPIDKLIALTSEKAAFFIKLLGYIVSRRKTDTFTFGEEHSKAEIAEYLKAVFIGESVEKIYLISFDARDRVIGCDLLGEGTVNASEVLPRKAIEVAIGVSAASVSIAHNHPFGTTTPSSDDINLTRTFDMIFSGCGIKLQEHFIVAGQLCDTVIL